MGNLFDLSGKVALVTGGTRGIGEMIAAALLKRNARVYITSRKAQACDEACLRLSQYGNCSAFPSDLSDLDGIAGLRNWLFEREDQLDMLVNNAGAAWGEPFEEMSTAGWDRVMNLNTRSIFFLTQQLYPLLRKAAQTKSNVRVINIGSIEGETLPIEENSFVYPVSKAATHQLTRVLARRLASDGITVNTIAPGPFPSKMTEYALEDDEMRARVESLIPLGRIGSSDDIEGLMSFLASRASSYITGATIPLDGGYSNLR